MNEQHGGTVPERPAASPMPGALDALVRWSVEDEIEALRRMTEAAAGRKADPAKKCKD